MIQVTRRIQFCAGHRLLHHEGRCRHVHGHNYVALLTAETEPGAAERGDLAALDAVGRVVDFAVLKERIGGWIDRHWDHQFLVHRADAELLEFLRATQQPHYVLDLNPTAEAMADHLLRVVGPQVLPGTGVRLVRVDLWETENCFATAAL